MAPTAPAPTLPPTNSSPTVSIGSLTATATASPTVGSTGVLASIEHGSISLFGSDRRAHLEGKRLQLSLKSNTSGKLGVSGYLTARKAHKHLALGRQTVLVSASHTQSFSLGLPLTTIRQVQSDKRHHDPITAWITVTIRTVAGQTHTEHLTVQVD